MRNKFVLVVMLAGALGTGSAFAQLQEILGGSNAPPGKWPWIAVMVDAANPDNYAGQLCGGSLIHPSWVLTAAHCVENETTNSIEIIVGITDLNDPSAVRHRVSQIITHSQYNATTLDFDIALLRLSEPSFAPPIPLLIDLPLEAAGVQATVMGWGALNAAETQYPNLLQELSVPVVTRSAANQFLIYNGDVTTNMIPAGFLNQNLDSCVGDSGGPLVTWNAGIQSWVQLGIVSWGDICGTKYGVYTRVSNFRDWAMFYVLPEVLAFEQAWGVRGLYHDADGDGYGTFLEYAHNSDPLTDRPDRKPTFSLVNVGGTNYPAITYRRIRNTNNVEYYPEVTADLGQTWVPVDPVANQVGTPVILDTFTDQVTVRDDQPAAPNTQRFMRVRTGMKPVP